MKQQSAIQGLLVIDFLLKLLEESGITLQVAFDFIMSCRQKNEEVTIEAVKKWLVDSGQSVADAEESQEKLEAS